MLGWGSRVGNGHFLSGMTPVLVGPLAPSNGRSKPSTPGVGGGCQAGFPWEQKTGQQKNELTSLFRYYTVTSSDQAVRTDQDNMSNETMSTLRTRKASYPVGTSAGPVGHSAHCPVFLLCGSAALAAGISRRFSSSSLLPRSPGGAAQQSFFASVEALPGRPFRSSGPVGR